MMRAVCCAAVVMLHARGLGVLPFGAETLFAGGGLAVEFFFIVSGYLLAERACRSDNGSGSSLATDTGRYIGRQFGRIYPYYLFSFGLAFVGLTLIERPALSAVPARLFSAIFEILMIGPASGLLQPTQEFYNFATWYLSVLLLGSLLLYPICRRWKRSFTGIAAPLAGVFIAGYLFRTYGNLDLALFPGCLLRGVMDLCIGCAGYELAVRIAEKPHGRGVVALLTVVELGCYLLALRGMLFPTANFTDYQILLCFAVAVPISFSGASRTAAIPTQGRWFALIGKASLLVYLNHSFCRNIVMRAFEERSVLFQLAAYLALTAAATAACWLCVDWLCARLAKRAARRAGAAA